MTRPACEGCDTDYWFSIVPSERNLALSICNGSDERPACPVKDACLAEAIRVESLGPLTKDTVKGVFGGLTSRQRLPLIEPRCPRCHGPREPKRMYCPPCAVEARQETHERVAARKRMERAA